MLQRSNQSVPVTCSSTTPGASPPPPPLSFFAHSLTLRIYITRSRLLLFFSRCSSVLVGVKKTAIDRSHGYRRDCLRYRDPTQQFLLLFLSFSFHFSVIFILAFVRFGFLVARAKNGCRLVERFVPKHERGNASDTKRIERGGKKEWNSSDALHQKLSFPPASRSSTGRRIFDRSFIPRLTSRNCCPWIFFFSNESSMNRCRASIHHTHTRIHTCIHTRRKIIQE